MQRTSIKILSLALIVCTISVNIGFAQKKKVTAKKPAASANPFGGAPSTPAANSNPFGGAPASGSQPPKSSGAVDPFAPSSSKTSGGAVDPFAPAKPTGGAAGQPPANRQSGGNVPVLVVPSTTSNPLSDSVKPALRNASAITTDIKDRNPLQYDDIREDDAIYRHKIWKLIDAREKINAPFIYNEDEGNQLFFSIVFKAVIEDSVLAFEDDRFRKPYKDIAKFKAKFSGGMDTSDVQDLDGNIIRKEVRSKEFPVDSVYEFMIMEDVVFDKEASRLVHRIIGIAPMGPTILPSGKVIEGPHFPYFWVYYPDLRKTLAKKPVYNPKNLGARMTWEDYLENHHFSYYIVKSTMDNVKDQNLKEYIKDPMFRLFEGEKIRDKIFNYEQGLWAY
jgi:gliding motility associated protien GldN